MLLQKHPFLVFLIGARASGKSILGSLLAEELGLAFMDTDQQLRIACGLSVDELVARDGWSGFRARESEILRECAGARTVVATGGGMVLDPRNCEFMRATGTVVFLEAPAQLLSSRLAENPRTRQRPSLTGLPPAEEIAHVLAEREPIYRAAAHHIVDATRPFSELIQELSIIIIQTGRTTS